MADDTPLPPPPPPAGFRMTDRATGFPYDAFKAAGWTDSQLLQHGYMSRADEATRPTHLGNLPISADSIDRLDKAFTDLCDARGQHLSDLQYKLNEAYAELRTYRRVRRMLQAADGKELAEKLRVLNRLLGDPRDY